MSIAAKKPGFDNSAGNRNRRVGRFQNNANRTANRHRAVRDITIASVLPDQFTDSGNRFAQFRSGEFIEAQLFVAQDGTYEVDTAVAGQIDTIEQTITAEGAGADVRIKTLDNRRDSRFS
jgi:hypothetical protein